MPKENPMHPRGPNSEKRGWAELIIKTHLRDGRWHPSRPIFDFARDRGVGVQTIFAAARALGVKIDEQATGVWRLPKRDPPSPINPHQAFPDMRVISMAALDSAEESSLRLPNDEPIECAEDSMQQPPDNQLSLFAGS